MIFYGMENMILGYNKNIYLVVIPSWHRVHKTLNFLSDWGERSVLLFLISPFQPYLNLC